MSSFFVQRTNFLFYCMKDATKFLVLFFFQEWVTCPEVQPGKYFLTSWATTKAHIRRTPGRSRKDQLWLRVTNMSAWLMMLTWRYTAEDTSSVLLERDLTPKWSCRDIAIAIAIGFLLKSPRRNDEFKKSWVVLASLPRRMWCRSRSNRRARWLEQDKYR